ncbi:hypothetical protein [Candidatus Erwinia haradaeae]|uniref:hypothetical protein n=1 Tax=Candidatus Erwinia haradaeae TaxID=1922217 RepID=UPI001300514A|nr:hypothetical protein [Candidatus Erwinia haradaeae]
MICVCNGCGSLWQLVAPYLASGIIYALMNVNLTSVFYSDLKFQVTARQQAVT